MNQIRVSEEVVCSDTLIFYMPLMCVDFTFMLLRLDGDYDPVGCRQCIDREHSQGRLAVDEDMGILSLSGVQILP